MVWWAAVPTAAVATLYTVDPVQSEFVVQVFKTGAGAMLAHDHVVRATTYTGQIHFDPAAPGRGSGTIEVQTASLAVDEATTRQKYGLPSHLSEKDRRQIHQTMTSTAQLDVARYPVITLAVTRIEAQHAGTYTLTGTLTIRGITQIVTFPAQVEQRARALHIRGSLRFQQSRFGYAPYSALFGAVRNHDDVVLHFDVVALP